MREFPSVPLTVTTAPSIGAPEVSVTMPRIEPVSCASAHGGTNRNAKTVRSVRKAFTACICVVDSGAAEAGTFSALQSDKPLAEIFTL